jgi:inner membrane protein involved in colicin E2 resistance
MKTETNKPLPRGWKIFYILLLSVYGISFYLLLKNDLELLLPVVVILFVITDKSYKKITNSREVKWSDLISPLPKAIK